MQPPIYPGTLQQVPTLPTYSPISRQMLPLMSQVDSRTESIRLGQITMSSSYIIWALRRNKSAIHLHQLGYRGETHTNPLHRHSLDKCLGKLSKQSSSFLPSSRRLAVISPPRPNSAYSIAQKQLQQDVALNTVIYPGITHLRIRATDAIPDGANYVACNEIKLIGTSVNTPASAIDPILGAGDCASDTKFDIMYDFNTATTGARTTTSAQQHPTINSIFTTNVARWKPGEFGPGNHVFIIHSAGPGPSQRFVFTAMTTPQPIVLSQLTVNVGSNGPAPATAAVESSSKSDFPRARKLGTVSTSSSALNLNMYIARGTVYLRLTVKSNIPDGSNYGAYDHLKLTGFIAKDGWTTIGQGFHLARRERQFAVCCQRYCKYDPPDTTA
jgi:hypothetical protein